MKEKQTFPFQVVRDCSTVLPIDRVHVCSIIAHVWIFKQENFEENLPRLLNWFSVVDRENSES